MWRAHKKETRTGEINWVIQVGSACIGSSKSGRVYYMGHSSRGLLQNGQAVGVEALAVDPQRLHELLRVGHLPVRAKQGVDELDTGVGSEARATLLGGSEHGCLALLEKRAQLVHQALSGRDKVLQELLVLSLADPANGVLGAPVLSGEGDEQQPQVASNIGDGGRGATLLVHGPVVDPLAEVVGVKDTSQQQNGLLAGVPVLGGVSLGNSMAAEVLLGSLLGRGLLCAQRVRGTGADGLGSSGRDGGGGSANVVAVGSGRAGLGRWLGARGNGLLVRLLNKVGVGIEVGALRRVGRISVPSAKVM
jgi:hypothetical protein